MPHERSSPLRDDADTFTILRGVITVFTPAVDGTNAYDGVRAALEVQGKGRPWKDLTGNKRWESLPGSFNDSEDSPGAFGCLVGNDIVLGYSNALLLADGDDIWIVADKIEEGLYVAAAIYRYRDGRVWMQGKPQGVGSRLLTYGKVWLLQVALVLLVAGAFYQSAMDWERLLLILGVDVAASLLLILPMIGPGLAQAEHAERVLKRLGFANPSGINLARFQERAWKQTVFNLKLALEATRQRGRP